MDTQSLVQSEPYLFPILYKPTAFGELVLYYGAKIWAKEIPLSINSELEFNPSLSQIPTSTMKAISEILSWKGRGPQLELGGGIQGRDGIQRDRNLVRDVEREAGEGKGKPGENNILETKFGEQGAKAVLKSLRGTDRWRQDDGISVPVP